MARADGVGVELRLTTDMRIGFEGPRAIARTLLKEGDTRFCALSWSEHPPPYTGAEAYERLVWTAHHWQHWLARGRFPDHPWRSYLERSALTLKGLTFAPTRRADGGGDHVAARDPGRRAQLGLPLHAGSATPPSPCGRCTRSGFDWEANDFFWFIADVAERDHDLQIMYGVGGERVLTEETLDHLGGYEGARPVRIGNDAYSQRQHDVWGALLDSVYIHTTSERPARRPHLAGPRAAGRVRPGPLAGTGLRHLGGPRRPRHFTSSKVMCWVAADRGAKLAVIREEHELAERWRKAADEIHADICANALDDRGVFMQHYDTDALDASLLLMPLLRFLPPDDPRIRDTVLAIASELTVDGLVLRYRTEDTDDGMTGAGGHLHDLLLLAGLGAGRDRRARAGPRAVREAAVLRRPARPVRRGDRPPQRTPPGQLPPGVHPSGPDQRRHPRDPGRERGADQRAADAVPRARDGGHRRVTPARTGSQAPCMAPITFSEKAATVSGWAKSANQM